MTEQFSLARLIGTQPQMLVALLAGVLFWLYGGLQLLGGWIQARRTRSEVLRLGTGGNLRKPQRVISRRLNLLADRLAASRQVRAAAIDYEQDISVIERVLAAPIARARASAGILIIFGLLLTLINLRFAVIGMQDTFSGPPANGMSTSASAVADPAAIQRSMQAIVGSAGTAFGFSAVAIGAAALLLIIAVFQSAYVETTMTRCREWLSDAQYAIASDSAAVQTLDPTVALLEGLTHLNRLTATFENTNDSLKDLRLFGEGMQSATDSIRDAVAQLPAHIGQSVGSLGAEVTHTISQDLQHQLQYLTGLVAVYGDQHATLKTLIATAAESAAASKSAAESVKSIPEQLQAVALAIRDVVSASGSVRTSVDTLNQKVAALPAAEMRASLQSIDGAVTRLQHIHTEFGNIAQSIVATLRASNADAAKQIREEIALVKQALSTLTSAQSGDLGTVKVSISNLAQLVDGLRRSDHGRRVPDLDNLHERLERLSRKIDSLPWFMLRRMVSRS